MSGRNYIPIIMAFLSIWFIIDIMSGRNIIPIIDFLSGRNIILAIDFLSGRKIFPIGDMMSGTRSIRSYPPWAMTLCQTGAYFRKNGPEIGLIGQRTTIYCGAGS